MTGLYCSLSNPSLSPSLSPSPPSPLLLLHSCYHVIQTQTHTHTHTHTHTNTQINLPNLTCTQVLEQSILISHTHPLFPHSFLPSLPQSVCDPHTFMTLRSVFFSLPGCLTNT